MIIQKKHIIFIIIIIISFIACLFIKPNTVLQHDSIEKNNIDQKNVNTTITESKTINDYLIEINNIEDELCNLKNELKNIQEKTESSKKELDLLDKKISKQKGESIYKDKNWYDVFSFYNNYKEKIKKIDAIENNKKEKNESIKDLDKKRIEIMNNINFLSKQEENLKNTLTKINGKNIEQEDSVDILNVQKEILEESSKEIIINQLPAFISPCKGRITSQYGYRIHPISGEKKYHSGIDIGVEFGTPIVASNYGIVVLSGWYGGFGNCVIISHGEGCYTLYGHNAKLIVNVGDKIKQGQVIALAGSTGYSTGPHCHLSMWINNELVDPLSYLASSPENE